MITIQMYYEVINGQAPKLNKKINKLKTKEERERENRKIHRNIYIGLNNVAGSIQDLLEFIMIWQEISQIKGSVEDVYSTLRKYMISKYMLDIQYNQDLQKLIVSDNYKVYINLTTKQCSSNFDQVCNGLSREEDRFICQMDYRKIDQQLTWQDFV